MAENTNGAKKTKQVGGAKKGRITQKTTAEKQGGKRKARKIEAGETKLVRRGGGKKWNLRKNPHERGRKGGDNIRRSKKKGWRRVNWHGGGGLQRSKR